MAVWVAAGVVALLVVWIGITLLAGKTHVVIGFRECEAAMPG